MRVIADHIRTIAFSITDGQLPSNAKAGYVIRRILRRAVRYGYTFLERKDAFMYSLIPVLIETMGDAYPELTAQKTLIEKVIKEEEDSFLHTLETGIRLLDKKIEDAKSAGRKELAGVDAFTLYDTFGFPLDLTELILRENGMIADIEGFNVEMQKQKERARNAAAIETGDWVAVREGDSEFVGYDVFECEAEILRYRKIKQKNKELYQVVLSKTPFYAEMGGQVGDTGLLFNEEEKVDIIDTKRENNLPVHFLAKLPNDVTATFTAKINEKKRNQIECNHSATHLLHEALREVLGSHVEQKGSFVSADSLRFDFSHFQKVTDEELRQVEVIVGQKIRGGCKLEEFRNVPIAKANEMGAVALFGEKYGDEVRVIKFGDSVELCGGTHASETGRIGTIRIISESSVAAGVRRIEAVTAEKAEEYTFALQDTLRQLRQLMHNMPDLVQAVKKSIDENSEMKHQLENFVKEKAKRLKSELIARAIDRNGVKVMELVIDGSVEVIKDVAFQIRGEMKDSFVFVAGIKEIEKCTLMVMLSDDLVAEGLHAGKIVKEAAKHIQGGGGGQPHFATAGGKSPEGLSQAINHVIETAHK
jgi:alanine--tRNA ligase